MPDKLTPEACTKLIRLRLKWQKNGLTFVEAIELRDLEDVLEKAFPADEVIRFTPRRLTMSKTVLLARELELENRLRQINIEKFDLDPEDIIDFERLEGLKLEEHEVLMELGAVRLSLYGGCVV